MDLSRLKIFVAVADAGSFTAAAERLALTKSATSQGVAALERELVLALAEASRADRREPAFARLVAVLWDRLDHPSATPSLPLPADPRLRRIALAHLDGDDTALEELYLSLTPVGRLSEVA